MSDRESVGNKIDIALNQIAKMQAYNIVHGEEWIDKSNGEKIYFLHQLDFTSNAKNAPTCGRG